jgi:hypothetical protein
MRLPDRLSRLLMNTGWILAAIQLLDAVGTEIAACIPAGWPHAIAIGSAIGLVAALVLRGIQADYSTLRQTICGRDESPVAAGASGVA